MGNDVAGSVVTFPPVATVSAVSCRSVVGGTSIESDDDEIWV
jgi:hypothetical protein